MNDNKCCNINGCKLGFAVGILWGLGLLTVGILGWQCGYGLDFIKVIGSIYIGFDATLKGSFVGFIWGFVDLFVFGYLVALIYNCSCKSSCK